MMRHFFRIGQMNLEFILALLFAILLFTSLFSLYSSQARSERERGSDAEANMAAESLGKAINILSSSASITSANISLPSGSYSLSLKSRRVVSTLGAKESTYPLITDSVSLDLPNNGREIPAGSSLTLTKANGAIHVSIR